MRTVGQSELCAELKENFFKTTKKGIKLPEGMLETTPIFENRVKELLVAAKDRVLSLEVRKMMNLLSELQFFFFESSRELFISFSRLNDFFDYFKFLPEARIQMLDDIIKLNVTRMYQEDTDWFYPDPEQVKNHKFVLLKDEMRDQYIEEDGLNFLIQRPTNKRIYKLQIELKFFVIDHPLDISHIKDKCIIIESITSKENISEEELEDLLIAYQNLSMGVLGKKIVRSLRKKKKEIDKSDEKIISSPKQESVINTSASSSQALPIIEKTIKIKRREINEVLRIVSQYFDLQEMKCKKILTLDEVLYVVYLLKSIDENENTIFDVIRIAEREVRQNNPILFYKNYKAKFLSLKEKLDLGDIMDDIEFFLGDQELLNGKERREVLKEIRDLLNILLQRVGNDFTYEIEHCKELTLANPEE